MRGAARALAALRRGLAATATVQPPAAQSALQRLQLQRGFSAGARAGGAAAAAASGRAQWLAAVAVGLSAGLGVQLYSAREPAECKAAEKKDSGSSKERVIDKEEVAKHRTKETGERQAVRGAVEVAAPVPAKWSAGWEQWRCKHRALQAWQGMGCVWRLAMAHPGGPDACELWGMLECCWRT